MAKVLLVRSHHNSSRVIKEAESLSKYGYDVDLFVWNRETNVKRETKEPYYHKYEYGLKAPYGKFRLFFYWLVWWYAIIVHLMKNDYNVVHVCGFDSYIPSIIGKIIKRYLIVYDIFDFFGESMPSNTPKTLQKFVSDVERHLIRFADAVILVDDSRRVQLKQAKFDRVEIIMNCVSDELPNIMNEIVKENTIFTIFYGGMLSTTRGLIQLIDSVKDKQDMHLIIAGSGEDESMLRSMISGCENIEFLGQISYRDALKHTYHANVVFALYDPIIPNNRLASPNKLFEAMMCATPVIVNRETTMSNIVKNYDCGIIIEYSNVDALKDALLRLKNNPLLCKRLGDNGRLAFKKRYNWQIMEDRLINLYNTLCAGK